MTTGWKSCRNDKEENFMMLIKGGRIVDPKNGMDQTADLVIENGKIKKIGTGLEDAAMRPSSTRPAAWLRRGLSTFTSTSAIPD